MDNTTTLLKCFGCSEIFTSMRDRDRHKSGLDGSVCLSPVSLGMNPVVPPTVNFICWELDDDGQRDG